MSEKPATDLTAITEALEKMLRPYKKKLEWSSSSTAQYGLSTRHVLPNKQMLYFAGFHPRKGYVSYYLMPVYVFPDLLDDISDDLRRRMQGKSCFNFKIVDKTLFKELAALTKAGYERYEKENLLK